MFTIVGAMGELERNVIRERILAGLEHARSRGTKSSRQIGRPPAVFDRAQVIDRRARGESWRDIASALGISTGTARTAFGTVQKSSARAAAAGVAMERIACAL